MNDDEKILISHINDTIRLCEKYAAARFTDFLDGAMQLCVKENIPYSDNIVMFGGYDESERKMLGVFPEWIVPEYEEFPISVLKITHNYGSDLSHRDYLGTIMSLGIDRNKTGDILIDGNTAYIFVQSDISSYIQNNISKIGNKGVNISVCTINEISIPKRKFEDMHVIAASMRIDAVVSAVTKLSRSQSLNLIESGKVNVNYREILKGAYELKQGDLLSIRGYGRVIVDAIGSNTRSGKLHLTVKKYI